MQAILNSAFGDCCGMGHIICPGCERHVCPAECMILYDSIEDEQRICADCYIGYYTYIELWLSGNNYGLSLNDFLRRLNAGLHQK